jgi:hypothetical protein
LIAFWGGAWENSAPDNQRRNLPWSGGDPIDVVNADFNNDGFLDLANANSFSGTSNMRDVAVRLGSGQGTFDQDPRFFDAGSSVGGGPRSLATRDLNEDTFLDLVVTFGSGTFSKTSATRTTGLQWIPSPS